MTRMARMLTCVALVSALLAGCGGTPGSWGAPGSSGAPSSAAGSGSEASAAPTVRIASLTGPTTMGLVGLMRDAEAGTAAQDYAVSVFGTADEVVPRLVQGQVDIALLPANLASVLYQRTRTDDGAQVAVAAITTLGVLEVLESGADTIDTVADLAGRTVYSTGKGTTPEYVLDYLLARNGLDPATDVRVEFTSEATQVAALLAGTPGALGVLPQPYATVLKAQHPQIRTALRLSEEWAAVTPDSALVTGVAVLRTDFARAHPEAVETFLADYAASAALTNEHPAQAAPLVAAAGITPSAEVAEAAIGSCAIVAITGAEVRSLLGGYLQVLHAADPAAVGGSVPGDDFYYQG